MPPNGFSDAFLEMRREEARATISAMLRWSNAATATIVVLVLTVAGCSSGEPKGPVAPRTTAASEMNESEKVQRAVKAVEQSLPDAPIWKGMTFAGFVVDDSTVCVDRTWRPGGGIDGKGGSAGYVLVTFPGETLGDPTDGVCSDAARQPNASSAGPVAVPERLEDEPGLVTRTELGTKWPLTVDYSVVGCRNTSVGGRALNIATITAPDGTVYALNGTAKDHTDARDIDPIWAPDPAGHGLKVDIGPLLDRARSFC